MIVQALAIVSPGINSGWDWRINRQYLATGARGVSDATGHMPTMEGAIGKVVRECTRAPSDATKWTMQPDGAFVWSGEWTE